MPTADSFTQTDVERARVAIWRIYQHALRAAEQVEEIDEDEMGGATPDCLPAKGVAPNELGDGGKFTNESGHSSPAAPGF